MRIGAQVCDRGIKRQASDCRQQRAQAGRFADYLRGGGTRDHHLAGSRKTLRQAPEGGAGKRRGPLAQSVRQKVLAISASSIDRLLAPCRVSLGARARCGTRPGTLLRKQIPVRTEHWDVSMPGFIEADTVAHCGENAL
jgi:hypothetical protein